MADIDEDDPGTSLHNQSNDEDNDAGDETQDFLFLAQSLSAKSGQVLKRGEKDFEPHGTKHQESVLAASRQVMHDVLDYTRSHIPKGYCRGFYYGEDEWLYHAIMSKDRRRGLGDDYVVMVESARGPHFRTMGKTPLGFQGARLWLLPEEALYLVERGNLDLWWPSRSPDVTSTDFNEEEMDTEDCETGEDAQEEKHDGVPMSLQATYAMLVGDDGERGKISMERYTVYANLKRTGYVVVRAPEWDPRIPGTSAHRLPEPSQSIFSWLFQTIFDKMEIGRPPYGPLVKPGLYRSYNSIYRQIAIVPRHKPSPILNDLLPPPEHPYRIVFHVWKPARISTYSKSNPGDPDFRVAVVDARSSSIPSLVEIASLLESTPWDPPKEEWTGPTKSYQRLRHGWRNVILAVNDQGIISYLRMGEAAFGEEKMYERFDRGKGPATKRGGGRAPGRGRGRGRS